MRAHPPAMLCLLLAGCGAPGGEPTAAASAGSVIAPSPSSVRSAAAAITPAAGAARSVELESDAYNFAYAYPAAAGAVPGVKAVLDAGLARARTALQAEAGQDAAQARKDGYPFHAHEAQFAWNVVTDLPDWLSLSAKVYTFSGGAHGMTSFRTLLWDKRAGQQVQPADLFTSPAALRDAVRQPFCAALQAERAKRRQGEEMGDIPEFSRCIDPLDATVILGSADRRHFTRIGFLIEPYSAGPYAEGTYEITVPVTAAVVAAARPEYRAALAARSNPAR